MKQGNLYLNHDNKWNIKQEMLSGVKQKYWEKIRQGPKMVNFGSIKFEVGSLWIRTYF